VFVHPGALEIYGFKDFGPLKFCERGYSFVLVMFVRLQKQVRLLYGVQAGYCTEGGQC
jgi:hypothetical protein